MSVMQILYWVKLTRLVQRKKDILNKTKVLFYNKVSKNESRIDNSIQILRIGTKKKQKKRLKD